MSRPSADFQGAGSREALESSTSADPKRTAPKAPRAPRKLRASRSPGSRELSAAAAWEERLAELRKFSERHGHWNVPRGWSENPSLSYWVINLRYRLRAGLLPEDRVRQLQDSGIVWSSAEERAESREQAWARMFRKLADFMNTQGHADVASARRPDRKLARWLANQRYLMRSGNLPEDRRKKLEGLGMLWNIGRGRSKARDEAWEQMFAEAKKFKNRQGSAPAGADAPMNSRLARWLAYQRSRLRRNALPDDRRHRILELGPEPPMSRVREMAWQRLYASLVDYRRTHGHCRVPRSYPENPRLGRWLSQQRHLMRAGRLAASRKELLERLGLEWRMPASPMGNGDLRWDRMFESLVQYQTDHGDTNVPRRCKDPEGLGDWVARQRQLLRSGRLRPDRKMRLARIGFAGALARTAVGATQVRRSDGRPDPAKAIS